MITDKNKYFLAQYGSKQTMHSMLDDPKVQYDHHTDFISENHLLDGEIAKKIIDHPKISDYTKSMVFQSGKVDHATLAHSIKTSIHYGAMAVRAPNLTIDHVDHILEHGDERQKTALSGNDEVMAKFKDHILSHPKAGKQMTFHYVHNNFTFSPEEFDRFVDHPDDSIRANMAKKHNGLLAHHIEKLLKDKSPGVRANLAMNHGLHRNMTAKLLDDKDSSVATLARYTLGRT